MMNTHTVADAPLIAIRVGRYFPLALLMLMATVFPLYAASDDTEQTSRGFGDSYPQALSSALLGSVQQARGVEAGTLKGLKFDLNAIAAADTFLQIDGRIEQTNETYTQSRGWIKSYRVIDVKRPTGEDGSWEVTVSAVIPRYRQAIPDDQRQTIAVIPFRTANSDFSIADSRQNSVQVARRLAQAIQNRLVQSSHYAVLNRNFDDELNREQQLWRSGRVNPAEAGRLGEQLGADFMLFGTLDRFTLDHKSNEFYGADMGGPRAEVELSYQLVESATGKVIWSDQARWYKAINENRNLFTEDRPHPLGELISSLGSEIAIELLRATAPADAVEKIINRAAPADDKVVKPTDGRPLTPGSSDRPVNW